MRIRRVVSLTMLLSFVVMVYTGIMLFVCPHGRVAYWTGWRLLGLSKEQYGELHTTFMVTFVVSGIWHITLNWKPITNYLKSRSRELKIFTPEFDLSMLLAVAFAVGTLAGIPPWSSLLAWQASIKDFWERRDGSPPWGHAEENSLARFTRGLLNWERLEHERIVRLSGTEALAALRDAGLTVEGEHQRLVDIARTNGTTPQALMAILREAQILLAEDEEPKAPARSSDGPFLLPFSGLGRMSLTEYCDKYDLDLDHLLSLFPESFSVGPDSKFRELAGELNTDPEGVVEMLNERSRNETPFGPR